MSKCREPAGGSNEAWRRKAQRRVLNTVKFPEAEPVGAESEVKGRGERTLPKNPEPRTVAPCGAQSKRR
jgi:hypothetical protein